MEKLRILKKANFLDTIIIQMYLAIVLGVIAAVLIISPDSVISRDTDNKALKMIHENSLMLGLACGGLAAYFYTSKEKKEGVSSEMSEELPTYEASSDSK
jgi:hypothetical protein